MKNRLFEKHTANLFATLFCAGALLSGTFSVPSSDFAPAVKAETIKIDNPVGYATNVFKSEFGNAAHTSPVLKTDFILSDEIKFIKSNPNSFNCGSSSYDSYEKLADNISSDLKKRANIHADEYFFLSTSQECFKDFFADKRQYATQYYYRYHRYISEYTLTLENNAHFTKEYSDKLNLFFLDALDKLSEEELSYSEFFDRYGTHVITGVDFGTKFEAYYGCVFDKFLSDKEWGELRDIVENSMVESLNSGEESYWNPSDRVNGKFGLNFHGITHTTKTDKFDDTPLVIGYSSLLPFYEILPEKYSALAEPMKTAFEEYATANTDLHEDSFLPVPTPDSSSEDSQNPQPEESKNGLKTVLICTACVVVFAGIIIALVVYFRKRKRT